MTEYRPQRRAAAPGGRCPVVPVPGDLLVSSVDVMADAFEQAVVLVLDADESGTTGVILNKAAPVDVEDVLPGWGRLATMPGSLGFGGPVAADGALCLARPRDVRAAGPDWLPCYDDVGLLPLDTPPDAVEGVFDQLRILVGYSGWGPGQLAGEIEHGLWHVLPATPADPFDPDGTTLWRRVLRRAPGELAYFSTWTPDPEWN